MLKTGETNLAKLLSAMSPRLLDEEYVFLSLEHAKYGDCSELNPIATVQESEGLTFVVPRHKADQEGFSYQSVFRAITLEVHSSLDAVGLTAAFAKALSDYNISANVLAGYFHDHIFVADCDALKALEALSNLSNNLAN